MAPNTKKQQALRRIEKAVGDIMPRDIWTPMSALTVRELDRLAEWIEEVNSGKERTSVVPLRDFEKD